MMQKLALRNKQFLNLNFNPSYNYKLTRPRRNFTDYDFEKFQYQADVKEYRKKHQEEHFERQTLLENEFIESYNKQQLQKQRLNEIKYRTSICKISNATQQRIQQIKVKSQKKLDKLKKYQIEQDINKINRRQIVQMLNEESQSWYNQDNLDQLKDRNLIPNFIYNETDYYLKLNEEALLYSVGDFDGLEELQSENKYIKYKNKLLMPIYQEIVSLVKHMKNTSLSKLDKEYQVALSILNKNYTEFSQQEEKQQQIEKLNLAFDVLRKKALKDLESNQVQFMREHLLMVYNLLDLWLQYTTIVKMSNSVAEQLMKQEQQKYEVYKSESKEDFNSFEDVLKSASEQETTDDEETIDLEAYHQDKKYMQENAENIKKSVEEQMQNEQPKQGDVKMEFEQMLQDLESEKNQQEFEQQFEEKWAFKNQNKEQSDFVLGKGYEKSENAKKLYENVDLENIFPRSLINSVQNYKPHLKYNNIEQIQKKEEGSSILLNGLEEENKQLNTSLICQVFRERASQMQDSNKGQGQVQEINQLLDLISQQTINEPRFLLQVWNTY